VSQIRGTRALLPVLAVGAALLCFTTSALAGPREQTIVRNEHVASTGVYDVRISILTRAASGNVVNLEIGKLWRRATTGRRHRRASVRVEVAIHGRMLTIRATGQRGTPKLEIRLRRVRSLTARTHGTPAAPHGPGGKTRPSGPHTSPAPSTGGGGLGGPIGVAGSWHSIFDDEFTGSTLHTSKWSTGWFGSGITPPVGSSELQCYDPNQVAVTNGELDLNLITKTENCDGHPHPYASGIITTNGKFSYTYGYLEARVWLSGNGAITDWPAV
jgi:hypothetical protein